MTTLSMTTKQIVIIVTIWLAEGFELCTTTGALLVKKNISTLECRKLILDPATIATTTCHAS